LLFTDPWPRISRSNSAADTTDEEKPGARDAYQRAEHARERTHPLWVGLTLAALARYPFDRSAAPGPVLADGLGERAYPVAPVGLLP
jgi:hypothetical protein